MRGRRCIITCGFAAAQLPRLTVMNRPRRFDGPLVGTYHKTVAASRWLRSSSRLWSAAFAMRDQPREVRRRAQAMIASVIVGMVAVGAVVATILVSHANALISWSADQSAQHSLDLLGTVGANMPNLNPSVLRHGLSPASTNELRAAVLRGQQDGLLSSLTIWDARRTIIYSSDGALDKSASPRLASSLAKAYGGQSVTAEAPLERDLASHQPTGTLVAFEPLRDRYGHIYGAMAIDLPLQPIVDQTAQERSAILIFVIAGAVILWLIALPFITRAALAIALSWAPGRRRQLNDFARALNHNAIELVYQPQIDPSTGTLHGFEALVRWRRGGKLQTPDKFLPLIETSKLMTDLTDRVIDLATTQLAAWRNAGHTPRVSINLSATDLDDDTLATRIDAALSRHAIPSDQLTVEVTETAILRDAGCAQRVLGMIRDLGVQISVDDFGTGHASISRLHRFPIDEVKIDRSFVTPTDERTRSYLAAIVNFGQSLGLRVVAEGIEDRATLAYVAELDCDVAQGYQIARPAPAGQVSDWLSNNARLDPTPTLVPAIAA
jgi:EAL domain-containing protein (putative c-di-GMP-specific phosphodiesterase class I)